MSVMIENTEELLALLKKMDLKVTSVDELDHLLATINANYNPDVARQKTGRLLAATVPGYMAGAAAFATFCVGASVGGLALIWGSVAVVSTAAVMSAAIVTCGRRGRASLENVSNPNTMFGEELVTGIRKELS